MKNWLVSLTVIIGILVASNIASWYLYFQDDGSSAQDISLEKLIELAKDEDFYNEVIQPGVEYFIENPPEPPPPPNPENVTLRDDDHIFGNSDAEIVLIEYSDLECPFCLRFHSTAEEAVEKYNGEVAWVYRHFPLNSIHPGAQKKGEASECVADLAGNDAFWEFVAIVLEQGGALAVEDLRPIAEQVGADGAAFQECLDSGEMESRVTTDLNEGASYGVTGTPGNILLNTETGETRLISGAVPIAVIEAGIEDLKK